MASVQNQLDSLRGLLWLYSQARLWGAPRRFEYVGPNVKGSQKERRELGHELTQAHLGLFRRIREAQKHLLATGFSVPDAWLTVRAVGEVSSRQTAAAGGKPATAVLADSGADLAGLESVCREMSVAALRLEAQVETPAVDGKPATKPLTERHDVPVTLVEFVAAYCIADSRLTPARLESLVKTLQSAARRKGSGVVLPAHVGMWRPGRKKYYRPSQLRAVWPSIARHLPYLPVLKPVKP